MFRRLKVPLAVALASGGAVLGASLAVAAKPDLGEQIDSGQSEATLIADRISSQGARIAQLEAESEAAAAREQQLLAQLEQSTARSTELSAQLLVAEEELNGVRDRYRRAIDVLAARLVAIYKGSEPDALTVVLEADGYDDLQTRAEYLEALTESDERIAERVSDLRAEVTATYEEIAALKAAIDEEARKLDASRAEVASIRAETRRRADELSAAKADAEAALKELQEKISGWELELRKQIAAEIGGAGEAFLGGPYSIPTYIVICESGGNYRALNPSSGAGGAYQILPSTWRSYGGRGLPHRASKAEQDRIAALIWADVGAGAWSCA